MNPGSCLKFINYIEKNYNVTHGKEFIITYNPHLIALGSIYNDVINSDVVLIGSNDNFGFKYLKNIFTNIQE